MTRLTGLAIPYGKESRDLGGFIEIIRADAFKASLADANAILALHHHRDHDVLGATSSGALKLRAAKDGVHFEVELPDTHRASDLAKLVRRRDVREMSFGFAIDRGDSSRATERALRFRGQKVTDTDRRRFTGIAVVPAARIWLQRRLGHWIRQGNAAVSRKVRDELASLGVEIEPRAGKSTGERWYQDSKGRIVREVLRAHLFEVSTLGVGLAAYPQTNVRVQE